MNDLILDFFIHPASPRQKQYEAVRAIFVDQEVLIFPDNL